MCSLCVRNYVRYLVYVFLLWNYDAIFAVVVYFRVNIIIIPIVLCFIVLGCYILFRVVITCMCLYIS